MFRSEIKTQLNGEFKFIKNMSRTKFYEFVSEVVERFRTNLRREGVTASVVGLIHWALSRDALAARGAVESSAVQLMTWKTVTASAVAGFAAAAGVLLLLDPFGDDERPPVPERGATLAGADLAEGPGAPPVPTVDEALPELKPTLSDVEASTIGDPEAALMAAAWVDEWNALELSIAQAANREGTSKLLLGFVLQGVNADGGARLSYPNFAKDKPTDWICQGATRGSVLVVLCEEGDNLASDRINGRLYVGWLEAGERPPGTSACGNSWVVMRDHALPSEPWCFHPERLGSGWFWVADGAPQASYESVCELRARERYCSGAQGRWNLRDPSADELSARGLPPAQPRTDQQLVVPSKPRPAVHEPSSRPATP